MVNLIRPTMVKVTGFSIEANCNPIIHPVAIHICSFRILNPYSTYSCDNISQQPAQPFAHLILISGSAAIQFNLYFILGHTDRTKSYILAPIFIIAWSSIHHELCILFDLYHIPKGKYFLWASHTFFDFHHIAVYMS